MLNNSLVLIEENPGKGVSRFTQVLAIKFYELVVCHALVPCFAVDEPVGPGFRGRTRQLAVGEF